MKKIPWQAIAHMYSETLLDIDMELSRLMQEIAYYRELKITGEMSIHDMEELYVSIRSSISRLDGLKQDCVELAIGLHDHLNQEQ